MFKAIFPKKKDDNLKDTLDSKYHYDSLLHFFKYLITLSGIFFGFIIYLTYGSFNEMKADMKERAKEMETEFERKTKKIDAKLIELDSDALQTIEKTKLNAISEISSVRNDAKVIAIAAANTQIEQVFKDNNIDSFIINVAKKHIEPQIAKAIENRGKAKINAAILKFKDGEYSKMDEACREFVLYSDYRLLKEQQIEVIGIIKKMEPESPYRYFLIDHLFLEESVETTDFFKNLLLDDKDNPVIVKKTIDYMIKPGKKLDINFFNKAIQANPGNVCLFFIDDALKINNEVVLPFLNSHELVDLIYKNIPYMVESLKRNYKVDLSGYLTEEQINSTYFFTKESDLKH